MPGSLITLPPLRISVFASSAQRSMMVGRPLQTHLQPWLDDDLRSNDRVRVDDCLLLSCAYPTVDKTLQWTTQEDGVFYLPESAISLNTESHPLARFEPGLRVQLIYDKDCSHILSTSLSYAECCKTLLQGYNYVKMQETTEDGMTYLLTVRTENNSKITQQLQNTIDTLAVHAATMQNKLGAALTTPEAVTRSVMEAKVARKLALDQILNQLKTNFKQADFLDLAASRALGSQVTFDQQGIKQVRIGATLSSCFPQMLLHATVAQAGLITNICQASGVPLDSPAMVFNAVQAYISNQGMEALEHVFNTEVQKIYCANSEYKFDPTFATAMQVKKSVANADKTLTLTVQASLVKTDKPGEDQSVAPGIELRDWLLANIQAQKDGNKNSMSVGDNIALSIRGGEVECPLKKSDCEDGDYFMTSAMDEVFKKDPQELQAAQKSIIQQLPADIKLHQSSISLITTKLLEHKLTQETKFTNSTHVPQKELNHSMLVDLVQKNTKQFASVTCATSLLASSPQLSASLSQLAPSSSQKSAERTAEEFTKWWSAQIFSGTGAESSTNLAGHSVCTRLSIAPVLSTTANDCAVQVFLLNRDEMKINESTALARQMPVGADNAAVRLNVATPAGQPVAEAGALALRRRLRLQLQTALSASEPLTMCMACNVLSTLTAQEMKIMQQAQNSSPFPANARDESGVPIIAPMQIFAPVDPDAPTDLKVRQTRDGFYQVMLVGDEGFFHLVAENSNRIFQGAPMNTTLKDTKTIVFKTPIGNEEKEGLRGLGALSALFVLGAEIMPSVRLMPMALQQTMQFCPVNGHLVPLSPQQLRNVQNPCGILVKKSLYARGSDGQLDPGLVLNNMTEMLKRTWDVVGKPVYVTGGPWAHSMMLTFA